MNKVHTTSSRWKFGLFLTLVAAIFWGTLPIALKVLATNMDAVAITFYRLALAFLILFVFLTVRRKLPKIRGTKMPTIVLMAVTCLGLIVNYITYVIGVDIVGPGPAQLLIQVNAIFVILGEIVIFRESFNWIQAAGLLGILVGLALFFHNRIVELFSANSTYSLGVLTLLLSALALASYALAQKQLLTKFSSLQISMLVFGAGTLVLLPVAAQDITQIFQLNRLNILLLLFCVLTTLGAFVSYAEALQHWQATKISAVLATVPLISLGGSELTVFFFPSLFAVAPLTLTSMIGAAVLVAGSYLIARRNS